MIGHAVRPLSTARLAVIAAGVLVPPVFAQTLSFSDQTAAAGLVAMHMPAPGTPMGLMMSGAAAFDFDRDGWTDLFVSSGGGVPDLLYRNNGDGTFTDVSAALGLDLPTMSNGVTAGDFDGDGWVDLFLTSFGSPPDAGTGAHRLYRNVGGTSFVDVAVAAGVASGSASDADGFGSAFGDYDRDGDLDLFVAGWVADSLGNRLFRNEGNGTFSDVTQAAIAADLSPVHGFTPMFVDMDRDRFPELLLAADYRTSVYLVNQRDGTFVDATVSSGTSRESNGMGSIVADFDGDGRIDWYVTSIFGGGMLALPGNMLYLNQGGHVFAEVGQVAGVKDGGWGWGTVAVDFDLDGDVDIAEVNGFGDEFQFLEWKNEPLYLFLNDGAASFTEAAAGAGLVDTNSGRGLVHFDYDRDGDVDLVVLPWNAPLRLFRNDLTGPGTSWLRVELDRAGVADVATQGLGAEVEIAYAGKSAVRAVHGGGSYLSQCEIGAHFGLGGAGGVDQVLVRWANGTDTYVEHVAANRVLTVGANTGWRQIERGTRGVAGVPELVGIGELTPGNTVALRVTDAAPSARAWLVVRAAGLPTGWPGGTHALVVALATDAAGTLGYRAELPALPSGSELYFRVFVADAASPTGLASTGLVRATTK